MKTLTQIFLVMLLLGLICAPVYYLCCTHLSGKRLGEYDLFALDMSSVAVDGVTSRGVRGEDAPISPVALKLTPEMGSIAVLLSGHYVPPLIGRKETTFRVKLSNTNNILWEDAINVQAENRQKKQGLSLKDVKIGRMGLDSFNLHVQTFSVSNACLCNLSVSREGMPNLHVVDMKAKVRSNVLPANRYVVMVGCVAFGVALIGLISIAIIKKNNTI